MDDDSMVADLLCQEPPLTESSFHDEDLPIRLRTHSYGTNYSNAALSASTSTSGARAADLHSSVHTDMVDAPNSNGSPQSVVDESSLQKQKDKNKNSLKVKLMMRRPMSQLIDAGIMPPPKTPSAFFEQRRHLERARTSDILKTKIEKRPDRQALVQQHILEDTRIAPSLQDRQRKLKRARLQDYLNDKLSHRPGPLELVQGNILKLSSYENDNPVIDGSISFKKTSEADSLRSSETDPQEAEEEADASSTASSPTGPLWSLKDLQVTSPASESTTTSLEALTKLPSPTSSVVSHSSCPSPQQQQQQQVSLPKRSNSLVQPDSSSPSGQGYPGSHVAATTSTSASATISCLSQSAPASQTSLATSSGSPTTPSLIASQQRRNSSNKKCRVKIPVQQKARTIKFHEYKGPPASQNKQNSKSGSSSSSATSVTESASMPAAQAKLGPLENESRYDILLRQQQLYLQLEVQRQAQLEQRKEHLRAAVSQAKNENTEANESSRPGTVTLTFPAQSQAAASNHQTHVSTLPARILVASNVPNRSASEAPPAPPPPTPAPKAVEEPPPPTPAPRRPSKPDDLKVNDLKGELKKRGLPVSGTKTQLLDRLKEYLSANANADSDDTTNHSATSNRSSSSEGAREKLEHDGPVLSPISVASEAPSVPKVPTVTAVPQTISFAQLNADQQQQATALALKALAMQAAAPNGVPLQNGQNNPVPIGQQAAPVTQEAVHHSVPTIFLATSQPTGQAFPAPCLSVPANCLPYIIMNGLSTATLNLMNSFNLGVQQSAAAAAAQTVQPTPTPVQKPPEVEQTSMQKLQQHLQQKILLQQLSKNQKQGVTNGDLGSQEEKKNAPAPVLTNPTLHHVLSAVNTNSVQVSQQPQQNEIKPDSCNTMDHDGLDGCYSNGHSSGMDTGFFDDMKSEAIDDVLEILIRNGELPPSAAQDCRSSSFSHSDPFLQKSSKMDLCPVSPESNGIRFGDCASMNASASSNGCGPLPPISSITTSSSFGSSALNGASFSQIGCQQSLSNCYLPPSYPMSSNNQMINANQNCGMDFDHSTASFGDANAVMHNGDFSQMNGMADDNSHNFWMDDGLYNDIFFDQDQPMNGSFAQNSSMQIDNSSNPFQSLHSMETDSIFNQASVDQMLDAILNEFSGSNGGFASNASLPPQNLPLYWSEADQKM